MKWLVVPILILLIATQAFSKWVILFEFQVNQEVIASTLCENKAKPQMQCAGKCQLKKMMAEEESRSSSPQKGKIKFQEIVFTTEAGNPSSVRTTSLLAKKYSPFLVRCYSSPARNIFHPPV